MGGYRTAHLPLNDRRARLLRISALVDRRVVVVAVLADIGGVAGRGAVDALIDGRRVEADEVVVAFRRPLEDGRRIARGPGRRIAAALVDRRRDGHRRGALGQRRLVALSDLLDGTRVDIAVAFTRSLGNPGGFTGALTRIVLRNGDDAAGAGSAATPQGRRAVLIEREGIVAVGLGDRGRIRRADRGSRPSELGRGQAADLGGVDDVIAAVDLGDVQYVGRVGVGKSRGGER